MALLDRLLGYRGEPEYMCTSPYDGNKYIDLDKFLKDERVRRQLDVKKPPRAEDPQEEDRSWK